jgi:uncharacterized protein (TIGR03083 family)
MLPPDPVHVLDLFPEERDTLLDLLSGLTPYEWALPTVCEGWSVHDVAAHILGGDLGNISRRRDRFQGITSLPDEQLVPFINRFNNDWVQASRRLSPRVLVDLLAIAGPQLFAYFNSLDLSAMGGGVSWAGLSQAPVWLDVAREYTERWLHQQHIRLAVNKPGLTERRYLQPVLSTFAFALPVAYRDTVAPPGTAVHLHIEGDAGGDWAIVRTADSWTLHSGYPPTPQARVTVDQQTAWKLFTKGLTPQQAEPEISFQGDPALCKPVLQAVAIIA